jgi:hypothetical protein
MIFLGFVVPNINWGLSSPGCLELGSPCQVVQLGARMPWSFQRQFDLQLSDHIQGIQALTFRRADHCCQTCTESGFCILQVPLLLED